MTRWCSEPRSVGSPSLSRTLVITTLVLVVFVCGCGKKEEKEPDPEQVKTAKGKEGESPVPLQDAVPQSDPAYQTMVGIESGFSETKRESTPAGSTKKSTQTSQIVSSPKSSQFQVQVVKGGEKSAQSVYIDSKRK